MLKYYFDKPKTVFKVNGCLLPFVSPFHGLAEMMGSFKRHGHMTVKVYSCQDPGGGSTYLSVPYLKQCNKNVATITN